MGVADYATDPDAPFADADAATAAGALVNAVGAPGEALTALVNGNATGAAIRAWLDARKADALVPADRVYVFFAGRGVFYPVGGYALGASQENRQAASRQASEPPHR